MYKYSLDKSSKKFNCPSCNKKRYVRYVDINSNNYLDYNFGRCDRESSCGYHFSPSGNTIVSHTLVVPKEIQPTFMNDDLLGAYGKDYNNNCFIKYLKMHFTVKEIKSAIRRYFLGTSHHWQGATVFWQIDQFMNIRTGKIMLYNKENGKRVKEPYSHITWIHSLLKKDNFVLQQCLFGIHNLCDYKTDDLICIVESEKTAVIMSMLYPEYLWLATGSKSNLKYELIKPLKNYNIVLLPDKLEFEDWNTKAMFFGRNGFSVTCNSLLNQLRVSSGSDLADILI